MKKTRFLGVVPLGLALAAAMGGSAIAAPTISITNPKEGAVIHKGAHPKTTIKGTVGFDPPPAATTTFYLRRDDCGGADNPHLSVVSGLDAGDGCGFVTDTAGVNDLTMNKEEYPAQDGVPFTLDASAGKTINGHFFVECFLSPDACGLGPETVDFVLTATTATGSVTVGTATTNYTFLPTDVDHDFAFTMTPDSSLNGKQLTSLNLETYIHGNAVLTGYVEYSGKSYFTVPTPATNNRRVEISIDDPNFVHPKVGKLNATFTGFSLQIKTPALGAHTIYARALQNGNVSTVAVRHFTVVT